MDKRDYNEIEAGCGHESCTAQERLEERIKDLIEEDDELCVLYLGQLKGEYDDPYEALLSVFGSLISQLIAGKLEEDFLHEHRN